MRNKWLALAAGLPLLLMTAGTTTAAEKSRDWKNGQVVESKSAAGPQIHTIASGGKNYLVRGALAGEDSLEVGSGLRFAVEGKTMFVSLEGREYRLNVVGETVAPQRDAELPRAAQAPPAVTPGPAVAAGVTAPRAETPQASVPQVDAPRAAAPPADALRASVPRVDAPQAAAPPVDALLASVPPLDTPRAAAPPLDAPRVEAPAVAAAPAKPTAGTVGTDRMPDGARLDGVVDGILDNDAIVKMVVGGLREETVVAVIQARPGKYNITPEAQAALRVAGVPPRVVGAMSAKMKP